MKKLTFKKGLVGVSLITALILGAKSFIGQEETPGNSGFKNKTFQKDMEAVGWRDGYAWCVLYCKLVWNRYIPAGPVHDRAMKLITPNSHTTLLNFQKDTSGYFVVTDSAVPGGIIIYRDYKNGIAQWGGHAGLCIDNTPNQMFRPPYDFVDVEGNTNSNGGREGYIVALKYRRYNTTTMNGLRYDKCISFNFKSPVVIKLLQTYRLKIAA